MEWSLKRKILYILMVAGTLTLLVSYPAYRVLHKTPTCFDKKQNGDEAGVDCGGSQCLLYCSTQIKAPRVVWADAFPVSPGFYDVGAYVENLNTAAGAKNVRYSIRIFDEGGQVIAERAGATEFAPASTRLIFEGNFRFDRKPEKVEIEFNKDDLNRFVKASVVPSVITIKNQSLKNTDTKPRFDATLRNTDLVNGVGRVELGAVVYDIARNPVAISRTYVEGISKGGEQPIFFTWPNRFAGNSKGGMCATPIDTMLVFDRSGSMDAGRRNPPEPLTAAKNAVSAYVAAADLAYNIGLVSFATTASNPVDSELSADHVKVAEEVAKIAVKKESLQHTNLGDALKSALDELGSSRRTQDAKRIIIALTNGVVDYPVDPSDSKNASYAEEYAMMQADTARSAGVDLYIIGLGNDLNEEFLRDRIATDPSHYFSAPTAENLQIIYKNISETVCRTEGFLTEIVITPRAVFTE